MITFEQHGEQFCAVKDGEVIAYVVKNYMGTHGHWRGWEHYLLYNGKMTNAMYPLTLSLIDIGTENCDDIPITFRNLNEFKNYYLQREVA